MLKIFLSALLVLAVNGALLGSKKCTYGPSYWCASFQQADECGATDHCHKVGWKVEPVAMQTADSDACTFCKDMISDVRNFIESNETQATILSYFNRACDFLPDDYSVQECKKIEQHYLDQFEQCIKDKVDPDTICKLCHLCSSDSTPKKDLVAQPLSAPKLTRVSLKTSAVSIRGKDDQLCEACKSFMDMVSNEIKDPKNQAMIKNMLENECSQLGTDLETECKAFVDMVFPEVVKALEQELTEQLCVTLTLCNSTGLSAVSGADAALTRLRANLRSAFLKNSITKTAAGLSADACDTCEMIAGYAKIFLSNNATEQQVQDLLETDVCPQLGQFADMCKTLVEEYIPQLYALLLKELDPATICGDLGLCNKTTTAIAASVPAVALVPAQTLEKKVKVRSSPSCILCEFVMSKLVDTLSDNATEEEIIQTIEKVCSLLPSTIRSECDDFVEKYGPALIKLIVNDVTPDTICKLLGVCSSGDSMYKKPLAEGDGGCNICEITMSYLQSLMEKNATQAKIVQTVEKVCNYLSGDIAQQCNTVIETYGPSIAKLVAENMKPKSVCTELGLCKASVKVDGLIHLLNSSNY